MVQVVLFTTTDNTLVGPTDQSFTLISGLSTANSTWETESALGVRFTPAALGQNVFIRLENIANNTGEFARFDTIYLRAVPEPSRAFLLGIAGIGILGRRRRTM